MAVTKHIIVIGAGVTGLTCAVFLAEAGWRVTVVAAHIPGDEDIEYASPWAGAHWRTHASPDEPMLCDWDVQTYNYWVELMEQEAKDTTLPRSGLKMFDQYSFWDQTTTEALWWKSHVQAFRELSNTHEPIRSINSQKPSHAPSVAHGVVCRAMTINVPRYLQYLTARLERASGRVIRAKLPTEQGFEHVLASAEEVAGQKAEGFVNATGLSAATVCGDPDMFPVRGQTVLVSGEAKAIRIRFGDDYTAYCLPRAGSGTTILGGTKQVGDWTATASPETTQEILDRCSWMVPELQTGPQGGFEVISSQCGLRPARKGGPRVSAETVGGCRVVHAYGHAGAGYQNSIGCARRVVELVKSTVGRDARL